MQAKHLRMARAGVDLTVRELADLAGVNKATVVRVEAGFAVRSASLIAIRRVLEQKGAFFLRDEETGYTVVGVR